MYRLGLVARTTAVLLRTTAGRREAALGATVEERGRAGRLGSAPRGARTGGVGEVRASSYKTWLGAHWAAAVAAAARRNFPTSSASISVDSPEIASAWLHIVPLGYQRWAEEVLPIPELAGLWRRPALMMVTADFAQKACNASAEPAPRAPCHTWARLRGHGQRRPCIARGSPPAR